MMTAKSIKSAAFESEKNGDVLLKKGHFPFPPCIKGKEGYFEFSNL